MEIESRMVVARGWGEGEMGNYYLVGTEFLFGMTKEFWKQILVMVIQHCECD